MARTRGPGAHRSEREAEIVDAVLEVVADDGIPAVSLSSVAARAGVSPGRVQHYFPTRARLVDAAFERGNAANSARIRDRVGGDLGTAAPREVVTAVLLELVPVGREARAQLRVRQFFTAQALTDEGIAARLRPMYHALHDELARLLGLDAAAGLLLPGVDPHRAAVRLTALAEGLATYVLVDVRPAEEAVAEVQSAVDALYRDPARPRKPDARSSGTRLP